MISQNRTRGLVRNSVLMMLLLTAAVLIALNTSTTVDAQATCEGAPWDAFTTNYNGGDKVYHNGIQYTAKYWVNAEPPSEEWEDNGACSTPPPNAALEGPVKIYYWVEWGVYGRDYWVDDLATQVEAGHINVIQYSFINIMPDQPSENGYDLAVDAAEGFQPGDCVYFDYWSARDKPGRGAYPQTGALRQLAALRDDHPDDLKIVMSLGGWTLSNEFSDIVTDPVKREFTINSCVEFMQRYQFDGIDIDWEYPGGGGEATSFREEDNENYVLFMKEFRERLDQAEAEDGGASYLLTGAYGNGEQRLDNILMKDLEPYMDYFSLMAYDLNGSWQELPAHNAGLYPSSYDPRTGDPDSNSRNYNVDYGIRGYLAGGTNIEGDIVQGGIHPSKLVLGIPFYGRAWAGVPNTEVAPGLPGLYTTSDSGTVDTTGGECGCEVSYSNMGPNLWDASVSPAVPNSVAPGEAGGSYEAAVFDYTDIKNTLLTNGYTRYWDDQAMVPYAYNESTGMLVSYDDTESIAAKMDYLKGHCLGGAMVWEASQDDDGELFAAITNGLQGYDPEGCVPTLTALPIGDDVPPAATPTPVTPTPVTPSEGGITVNCDYRWNLIDAILIKRNDAFLIPAVMDCTPGNPAVTNDEMYMPQCDVNNDTRCTLIDAVIIQQCNAFVMNAYCADLEAVNAAPMP